MLQIDGVRVRNSSRQRESTKKVLETKLTGGFNRMEIEFIPQMGLEGEEITLFPHPPKSPDLNPIETIWALMKQKLY